MSNLNIPKSGESILPWAQKATKELNSLNPSSGEGIKITKTANGTTISLDDKKLDRMPDSTPRLNGDGYYPGEGSKLTKGRYATYSLEINDQNAFSLYNFGNIKNEISNLQSVVALSDLASADFLIRVWGNENSSAILSSPTLVYQNISVLLSTEIIGEGELSNPTPILSALVDILSVNADSELTGDELVSKSIYRNSKGALALYDFENVMSTDILSSVGDDDYLLVRTEVSGVPTLKYVNGLSTSISGLTLSLDCVLSTEYSLSSHKLIEHYRTLEFSNGLLINISEGGERDVFQAVAEQV